MCWCDVWLWCDITKEDWDLVIPLLSYCIAGMFDEEKVGESSVIHQTKASSCN